MYEQDEEPLPAAKQEAAGPGWAKKPVVLVVVPMRLLPVVGGGLARVLAYIDYLRSVGFSVKVVTLPHTAACEAELRARTDGVWIFRPSLRERCADPGVQKAPPREAHRRLLSLVRRLVRRGKAAAPACGAAPSAIARARNPFFDAYAADIACQQKAAAVIAVFVWTARVFEHLPPQMLKITDTHDVQHLRADHAKHAGFDMERTRCTREEEAEELGRVDVIMAIQEDEVKMFKEMCPGKTVILAEHAFEVPETPLRSPDDSCELLFVGNLYEPNVIGINAFITSEWRDIRASFPQATLAVCGRVCEKTRPAGEGIRLEGIVPSLLPYYERAAIVVNPVPFGTGLKIKAVEALSLGKCLVSSPAGVTGLAGWDDCFIVKEIGNMAPAIIELLGNPARRRDLEARAHRAAAMRFSPKCAFRELETVLRESLKECAHR